MKQSIYRGFVLVPEEWEAFADITRKVFASGTDFRRHIAAREIRRRVEALAAAGDGPFNEHTDERIALEGYRVIGISALKQHRDAVVRVEGARVAMPEARSIRHRDEAGERYWQPKLWEDMSHEDVLQVVQTTVKQRSALGLTLAALAKVLALFERHPDATTLRDACDAEGIDWRDIDLDDAANA